MKDHDRQALDSVEISPAENEVAQLHRRIQELESIAQAAEDRLAQEQSERLRAEEASERRALQAKLVYEIGRQVSSELELDELFEAITLIQTHKLVQFPIVMVSTTYWGGLISWIRERMLSEGKITNEEMDIFSVVDKPEEAVAIIEDYYHRYALKPNF